MSSAETRKHLRLQERGKEQKSRLIETIRQAYLARITFAKGISIKTKNFLMKELNKAIDRNSLCQQPSHEIQELMLLTIIKILENEGIEFELENTLKSLK